MITIRPEQPKDIERITEVHTRAFQQESEAALVRLIRQSEFFVPALSLVAVSADNGVVGHVLFSEIMVKADSETIITLGLAPMAVSPEYQNRGIGSQLVEHGLKKCRELGYAHVIVLGHPDFYQKFGFINAVEQGIHPPFPVPENTFMVKELESSASGNLAGTVVYPPAFSEIT